jgi:hypothetical protein
MMDRDLILGPGSAAHVRTDAATPGSGARVAPRESCCTCKAGDCCATTGPRSRRRGAVEVDGRPLGPHAAVPLGRQVRAGGLSFVVTAG